MLITTTLVIAILVLLVANLAATIALLLKQAGSTEPDLAGVLRSELRTGRQEAAQAARELRHEISTGEKMRSDTIEKVRQTVDARLKEIQQGNEKKLDQMRQVVDEKLQSTLQKRLGESFKLVSDQLEAVQKGLGEMRHLAIGVGDLKKVLTNVKTRGTWGEVQLGALLEQVLAPDQFARNVQTHPSSRDMVEFAIRLPGPDGDSKQCVWLPIDAKFPQEDYLRLVDASEAGDAQAVLTARTALLRSIQNSARDVSAKYVYPPKTTDFAILFLPTEGLFAEAVREPGLVEQLQRDHRIVIAGPTTLAATLSSLRMGFQTLAIERRSSEVWKVLAAVKTEFGKFGDVLSRVGKQLDAARRTIDETGRRTRAMERTLRDVEELPSTIAPVLELIEAEPPEPVEAELPARIGHEEELPFSQ